MKYKVGDILKTIIYIDINNGVIEKTVKIIEADSDYVIKQVGEDISSIDIEIISQDKLDAQYLPIEEFDKVKTKMLNKIIDSELLFCSEDKKELLEEYNERLKEIEAQEKYYNNLRGYYVI